MTTQQSTQNIVAQSLTSNINKSTPPVSSDNKSTAQSAIAPISSPITNPTEESTRNIITQAFACELDDEVIGKTPLFVLDDLLTAGLIA